MIARFIRLFALTLVLGATLCVGVMFVGGLGIMFDLWQAKNLQFDAMAVRIQELRTWGLTGIGLFLLAVVLLWITPDRRDKNGLDEEAVQE